LYNKWCDCGYNFFCINFGLANAGSAGPVPPPLGIGKKHKQGESSPQEATRIDDNPNTKKLCCQYNKLSTVMGFVLESIPFVLKCLLPKQGFGS